jgi:phenylalanyl-tRNA synthetase beta chain
MEVNYEDKTIISPDLTPQEMNVHVDTANELIGGTELTAEDIKGLLEKARFDAEILNDNEEKELS